MRKVAGKFLFFRRWPKKVLIGLTVLIIIFGFFINSQVNSKEEEIKTTTVKKQDLKVTVSSSGTLTGKNKADLKFKTSGKLSYLNVKVNDQVTEKELLAGLDATSQVVALQQAKNNLRDKQATVDKTLDDTHLFQYGNGGFGNVGTSNETMTQKQLRTTAQVARDNAVDSVKEAQRAFSDVVIHSPLNGIVTQVNVVEGQNVSAADLIIQVVDESEVIFEAEVDESDFGKVSLGQLADVTLNATEEKIHRGTVTEILPTTKTTSSGATVVVVKIKLDPAGTRFTSGLNGQANIIIEEKPQTLSIPIECIKDENKVIVKIGEDYEERQIEKGLESDLFVEVKSGLTEGEEVVTNPEAVKNVGSQKKFGVF